MIYTVAVGSIDGDPIPIRNSQGEFLEYKKDKQNQIIISKVNDFDLKRMAIATNGEYFHSHNTQFIASDLYKVISNLDKKVLRPQ